MRCFFACFSLLLLAAPSRAADPALAFKISGKTVAVLTQAQLKGRLSSYTTSFFDPVYGKVKSYECLPMGGVMAAAFGARWRDGVHTEAVLQAQDGYASVTEAAKLSQKGGCLAVRDLDFPSWEPVGRRRIDPGPFYLTWEGPRQSAENGYPWPYQLASIDLVRFEERYPEVFPLGALPDTQVMAGFHLFRDRCLRCHSINREGGKVGPDLDAPQSVTSYRTKKWFKSYVRRPSFYRYTEMPDHTDLSDAQLEDLWEYLRWKARKPRR